MLNTYARLLTPFPDCVSEPGQPYHFLTERHLQAMWYEQKFFEFLKTDDNLPVTVISPGIWNSEGGPDFLKAHLRIGETEVKGDIEIHLRDNGWKQHGHQSNPAYDNVVLHVSLWHPKENIPLLTSQGQAIKKAYFEDFLTIAKEQLPSKFDLDLYPYRTHVGTGKCGQKLFPHLSVEKTEDFLTSAADWRLSQKKRALSLRLDSPGMQFAAGVAMALGYKNNTEAFYQLFLRLYKLRTLSEQTLLALALGGCGFFEQEWKKKWSGSTFYQELNELYLIHQDQAPGDIKLKLAQVRPFNHPVRRIAYLIKWICDPKLESYRDRFITHWSSNWQHCYTTRRWKRMQEALEGLIPQYDDPHWYSHYTFEEKKAGELLLLIGDSLKREILVNVVMPFIHHAINANGKEAELKAFHAFYSSLRSVPKGKTQYLVHRFFGGEEKGNLLKMAMLEQGAYQLHRDFCTHFEASCEGCPFIDRFNN